MKLLLLPASLLLCACGPYADFTLPPPDQDGPGGPFQWSALPDPVIPLGRAVDVLNPSVVRSATGYANYYSEYDGREWRTVIADSQDGVTWGQPSLALWPGEWEGGAIAANGSALSVGEDLYYWYQAGVPPRVWLAKRDGQVPLNRRQGAVLDVGPRGSFDESAVADPYVIRQEPGTVRVQQDGMFYMFYLGQDRAARQTIGIARSNDGIVWEKLRSNPVLGLGARGEFDERGLGEPAVWSSGGWWWMLYTGRDRFERRRMGLARSRDGVKWEKVEGFVIEGAYDWNREVMCDPTVEEMPDGSIRVWFGGGNVRSPDQNLNGQIGLGWLR